MTESECFANYFFLWTLLQAKKKQEMVQGLEEAIESKNAGMIEKAMMVYTANVSNNNQDQLLERAEQTLKALAVRKGSQENDVTNDQ